MNSATQVFCTFELLELILLSFSSDELEHIDELSWSRTVLLSQRLCRTWQAVVRDSLPVRRRFYLAPSEPPPILDHVFPVLFGQANPWISPLLWGPSDCIGYDEPDEENYAEPQVDSEQKKTLQQPMFVVVNLNHIMRLPPGNLWRDMVAASPPFTFVRARYLGMTRRLGGENCATYCVIDPEDLWFDSPWSHVPDNVRPGDNVAYCKTGITLGVMFDIAKYLSEVLPREKWDVLYLHAFNGPMRNSRLEITGFVPQATRP